MFLSGLPRLRTLEPHGTPISFPAPHSFRSVSTLLRPEDLPCLTSLRIFALGSSRENKNHYLGHLLAFLSKISTILSLQVEAGKGLMDLTNTLRPLGPLRGFSGLHTAAFRLIKSNHCELCGLLSALACHNHAVLRRLSQKEFALEFSPAKLYPGFRDIYGHAALAQVTFLFDTEQDLQEFLDITTDRKRGLKQFEICPHISVHPSRAVCVSKVVYGIDGHVYWQQVGRERKTAALACTGKEGVGLCLAPVLKRKD